MNLTRPVRTDAHRQRDFYLQQFADLGLVPIVSTNGGIPDADIQIVKGEQPGEVVDCWVTERGKWRFEQGSRALLDAMVAATLGESQPSGETR